ncbi:MAG: exodeoxyribonuclease III [Hyphomicrobiaceae bacterium]|nr:exodeoxyribonuclease III [Hyphomicrobiaceae bacterium]
MKIATWNINGIKARLETALTWTADSQPDVLCLQEIKCVDDAFPAAAFEGLGYNVAVHGQKGFNGVAVLAKPRFDEVRPGLPGAPEDAQARYLEVTVSGSFGALTVASIYLPNGNPVGTEKFDYKLAWMDRLSAHARHLLGEEHPLVLAGDFNVIPEPLDARNPDKWAADALFQPASRARYRALVHGGYTDAIRACHAGPDVFSFWDYQAGSWQKNDGIRIDHVLLSPQAADRLAAAGIDRRTRGWEKPSDHVPVWVELDLG